MPSLPDLWSPVEVRRDVDASPEDVFAVLADPHTYPDWLLGAQRIRSVDDGFPAVGTEFHHSVGVSDKAPTVDDSTEVTDAEPPHRLSLRVKAGPMRGTVELLLLPTKRGTEIRFRERPAGLQAICTPAVRLVLHGRNVESLRRLGAVVEARAEIKRPAQAKPKPRRKPAAESA